MFAKIDMATQQKKLLNALILVVESLRNPEALGSVLNSLGGRHVGYGAIPKHYPAIGKALLISFEQYLQDDWTLEVKQAWVAAFRTISAQMLKGAKEEYSPNITPNKTPEISDHVKVSYARILALQDLNTDAVSLRGLDAPSAELVDINLPRANLSAANLNKTDLSNANLSHANLDNAILSHAKLSGANLSHANLISICG